MKKYIRLLVTILFTSFMAFTMQVKNANANDIENGSDTSNSIPDKDSFISETVSVLESIGLTEMVKFEITAIEQTDDKILVESKCITGSTIDLSCYSIYDKESDPPYWQTVDILKYRESEDEEAVYYYLSDEYVPYFDIYDYKTGIIKSPKTLTNDGDIILIGNYYYGSIEGKHYIYKFHDEGIVEIVITNGSPKEDKVQVKKSYAAYEVDGRKIKMSAEDTNTFIISEDGRKIWLGENHFDICTEAGLLKKELKAFD